MFWIHGKLQGVRCLGLPGAGQGGASKQRQMVSASFKNTVSSPMVFQWTSTVPEDWTRLVGPHAHEGIAKVRPSIQHLCICSFKLRTKKAVITIKAILTSGHWRLWIRWHVRNLEIRYVLRYIDHNGVSTSASIICLCY